MLDGASLRLPATPPASRLNTITPASVPPRRLSWQECFPTFAFTDSMALKRKLLSDSSDAKKRKTITLQVKLNINKRHVKGEKASAIGYALVMSRTTVSTILKDKDRILAE